jgi:hypothetical protein
MSLAVFHGAMRPAGFGEIRNTGVSLMDVRHVVEFRAGRALQHGSWHDVWQAYGASHSLASLAGQAADKLRAEGHTVRVRPVIV